METGSLEPPHSRSHPARLTCVPCAPCEPVEPLPEEVAEENDVRSAPVLPLRTRSDSTAHRTACSPKLCWASQPRWVRSRLRRDTHSLLRQRSGSAEVTWA